MMRCSVVLVVVCHQSYRHLLECAIPEPCACSGVLQNLGWYDPLRKETNLNAPAIKKWLAVGAQPSDTVRALLKKAMVID